MQTQHFTPDSTAIAAVRWDGASAANGTMAVTFVSGRTYTYAGVSLRKFQAFRRAESAGRYFSAHVRGKFKTEAV